MRPYEIRPVGDAFLRPGAAWSDFRTHIPDTSSQNPTARRSEATEIATQIRSRQLFRELCQARY